MSDLIVNLQNIYATKLQIKDAIGTDSDIFSDYPSYITSLKPSGYAYITTNGDHNVNSYSYVNVNVPQGGAAVLGNLTVSENGQYSASSYAYDGFDVVNVNVPAVTPVLNSLSVYANGVYTPQTGVDGFNEVTVNVPTSGSSHSGQSTADAWTIEDAYSYISAFEDTAEHMAADLGFEPVVEGVVASVLPNRDYSSQYPTARFWITRDGSAVAADYSNGILCWNMQSNLAGTWTEGIDMQVYAGQHVFIQCTKLQKYLDSNTGNYQMECKNGTAIVRQTSANGQLTISQSGTYDTTSYVSAYVDVQGGGGAPTMNISGQYGVYNGKYFVYDTNNYTYLTFNGPLTNMNLGDTVSGYAEYVDFDGLGNSSTYLFKNFSGTGVQDPNRVYTNFTVGSYYGNSQTIISTISGSVSSQSTDLYSSGDMMATYSLPSNYSGPVIEAGSTVYCYVSTTNAMAMTQNLINEVVTVFAPTLTGMSYSTDNGMTWNSMSYDSLTGSYSVSGLSKTVSGGSSDNSIYIRQEFDNAAYKYVSPYIEFNSGSTSPIQMMVTPNTMMSAIQFYNMTGAAKEITGLDYNVNSTYLSVSFQQGVEYSYRIVATDSTGAPTGNKYAMQNDPALGWKYNNWYGENIEYFYIEKFITGESTGIESYKPASNTEMVNNTTYSVSSSNSGLFHMTDDTRNKIVFNLNSMLVSYVNEDYIVLMDGWSNTLCKVYQMSVGGNTYSPATTKSGVVFADSTKTTMYRTPEAVTITNGYDGSLTLDLNSTATLTFDGGGQYMMYYWDTIDGKGVFIHDSATV